MIHNPGLHKRSRQIVLVVPNPSLLIVRGNLKPRGLPLSILALYACVRDPALCGTLLSQIDVESLK